jgi:hypothetical protein
MLEGIMTKAGWESECERARKYFGGAQVRIPVVSRTINLSSN